MNKQILLSLITVASLFGTEEVKKEAKSLEDIFKLAEVKGEIRAVYQSNSKINDTASSGTLGSANDFLIGGKIAIETAPLAGFGVGATFYTANSIYSKKDYKDGDYYNSGNKGYSLLGEAFAKYANDSVEIKLGRMELDTPLVNSDDIRMVPNLYTAAALNYKATKELGVTVGVVTHMAGWENSSDETKFVKMGQIIDNGGALGGFFVANSSALDSKLYLAGITYEGDSITLQSWASRMSDIMDTYYVEGSLKAIDSEPLSVNLVAQYMGEKSIGKLNSYANHNPATKIDSTLYGAAIELESAMYGISGTFAFNKAGKKVGTLNDGGTAGFFGGGKDPLLTSMDVETANGAGDITAYKYEVGYDFEKAGIAGASASLAYAHFDHGVTNETHKETDFAVAYALNKTTLLEAMFSKIEVTNTKDNDRVRLYIKYDF